MATIDITPKIVRFDRYSFRSVASTVEKAEHMCRVREKSHAQILQWQKVEREKERKIQADKKAKIKAKEEAKRKAVKKIIVTWMKNHIFFFLMNKCQTWFSNLRKKVIQYFFWIKTVHQQKTVLF
mgnify:CR=1 FL=1